MSRLLRSTTCEGQPGSCKVQLTRNGPEFDPNKERQRPNLRKLETRLYEIHRALLALHPQDLEAARKLEQDAATTIAVLKAANGGELTINMNHIVKKINQLLKSGFGKIGMFFSHLTHREATIEPTAVDDVTDEAEKQRVLASIRFRKTLPLL